MQTENGQKIAYLICFVVISIAVVGYFVGLQSPMNPTTAEYRKLESDHQKLRTENRILDSGVIPAPHYDEIGEKNREAKKIWRTSLKDLKRDFDPLAEVIISPEQKSFALALREQNRAFNGAPPTIPHPAEQMSAQSCLACHGEGATTETLRISKMSHQFLANCTQCHVENNPQHMHASLFRENSFVGLPAPTGGPRAYEGAPPMIPHSTWMRVDCMSCHGYSGQHGIRTTHPWRQNCQQCHAPSSTLNQVQINSEPAFLQPLKINQ